MWWINSKGFEGHRLVVQSPFPNIGGSTGCHGNLPAFLESSKQPNGVGEQSGVTGDLPQCGYELRIFQEVSGRGLLIERFGRTSVGTDMRCQLRMGDAFNDNTNLINDFQQLRLLPCCQLPHHWDMTLEFQKCLKLWSSILPRGRVVQQPTAYSVRVPAG